MTTRTDAEPREPKIVLFDIDGVVLTRDGTPMAGGLALVDTLRCLGYEVHFWSAGGKLHVADALQRAGIYGSFTIHDKPTYPPTEAEALKIVGRRPALQIDDDATERVADWPFMIWDFSWAERPATLDAARAGAGLPPHTRLILASENLLDEWGTRTEDGERITVEWGEPTPEGWYEPTFTVHSEATLDAARAGAGLREAALAEAIFRVGMGYRKGMTALPWAIENQQEFARWIGDGKQIAAEYARLTEGAAE